MTVALLCVAGLLAGCGGDDDDEPVDRSTSSTTAAPTTTTTTAAPATYTVQAGDTLGAIAARLGTTVAVLVELNALADPNRLDVGQVLQVPAPDGSPTTTTTAP